MNRALQQTPGPRILALVMLASFLLCTGLPETCGSKEPQPVSFKATDGVTLHGTLFGEGATGVILAHMYPADQKSWFAFGRKLAERGYLALAFDCRGYGDSGGQKVVAEIDRDLEGAYRFLRPKAEKIFLVGASMGGTAAILVAARNQVAGVVSLSAPVAFQGLDARDASLKLGVPCLFIAAEEDGHAASAASQFRKSCAHPEPLLLIVPGSEHGTRLFDGASGQKVEEAILEFLEKH